MIEDGILKGICFDELNGTTNEYSINGNDRRESYTSNPIPRMTNTYMLGGKHTPEEIIASVEWFYLQKKIFEGGQVVKA